MEDADARRHRLTSSRAAMLMTGNYKTWNRLAFDMRSTQPLLGKKSGIPPLDWGIQYEPWVRAQFWERHPEWDIEKTGLVAYHDQSHPLFADHVAVSPDGFIRPGGWGFECKAPYNTDIHVGYVRAGALPAAYVPQVQFSLWATGWDRWVFASGDPRVFDGERYYELAVAPDPAYHARITELATEFLEGYTQAEEFKPRAHNAAAYAKMF